MNEIDYTPYFERIISLLEQDTDEKPERPTKELPVHSGHKGGEFMSEARTEFANRFKTSALQWKDVNRWITQLFKIGSQAKEGATVEDMIWLYQILRTSLENGFAQAMKHMGE